MSDAEVTTPPSQTQTAAQDAGDPAAPERGLKIHGKSWPLVNKMSLFSTASLQKALQNSDLEGIAHGLSRMSRAKYRDEIYEYLMADREDDDPEFIDDDVLLDAFRGAQEAFAARPTTK